MRRSELTRAYVRGFREASQRVTLHDGLGIWIFIYLFFACTLPLFYLIDQNGRGSSAHNGCCHIPAKQLHYPDTGDCLGGICACYFWTRSVLTFISTFIFFCTRGEHRFHPLSTEVTTTTTNKSQAGG